MDTTVKGQKWFKLPNKNATMRFNQKKFVKRFVRYNKETSPTNSTDEFDYFASTPTPTLTDSFDWRKKTREEIEDMKKEIQWKAFERIENFELVNRPEISKLFRGNKTRESEVGDPNEMWTLAQREPRQESCNESTPDDEKTTWKISRMSLPVTMNEKTGQFKMQNQNLLWRSLEHIQQLYEDEHLQELSEVISVQFENGISDNGLEMTSSCCVEKSRPGDIGAGNIRKARLSRWNFLRYDNSQRKSPRMKTSYSKLFTRNNNKKMSKREQSSPVDDGHPRKEHFDECSSNTEDSCTCSCCSCDTCTNSSTENSTGDALQTAR
ncbi:hypothetical protein RUM44_010971 [Polyplax serrata]|uniref:Uncharacterized protein n=1 Tax=Polyplax serrata TaxID=468196 RepID=A0ABR1ANP4_POLSC